MNKFCARAFTLVLLFASIAIGQVSQGPDRSLVFELEVYEFSTDLVRDIERIIQDRARTDRLIAEGKIHPVANISLRTKAGELASIRSGQRVPVQASQPGQGARQVTYDDTGFKLSITPTLSADDRITVAVNLDFSAPVRGANITDPIYYQRSLIEKFRMRPNEKVVLLSMAQYGALWPVTPAQRASDSVYGNFIAVLSGRVLD